MPGLPNCEKKSTIYVLLRYQVLAICYILEEVVERMWLMMAYNQDQAIGFILPLPLSLEGKF